MKVTSLTLIILALTASVSCSRLVSTEPLLADQPVSKTRWVGAYSGELGEKDDRLEMLLQLKEAADGNYAMTIHTRGRGKPLLDGRGQLSLIGVGEMRIIDLGDNYAVAQTRCEIASPLSAKSALLEAKWKTVLDAAKTLHEIGNDEDEASAPPPQYLGPYVYPLIRTKGDQVLTLLGTTEFSAREALGETDIGIHRTGDIAGGPGIVIAGNAVLEEDDLHIPPQANSEVLLGFFKRLAQQELHESRVEESGNVVRWHKLPSQKLKALEFSNRFPPEGWMRMWCNLSAANASPH